MTTKINPTGIGLLWDERDRDDDPQLVNFESQRHCCDGCQEHPSGDTGGSLTNIKVTVAADPDLLERDGLGVEIRFDFFGLPQRMRLNYAAADELAKALRWAIDFEAVGWKDDTSHGA